MVEFKNRASSLKANGYAIEIDRRCRHEGLSTGSGDKDYSQQILKEKKNEKINTKGL